MEDQAEGLRRLLARESVRAVTVTGGGGGVGKTSAVVNLAAALAHAGRDVMVLDENPGRNLNIALGLKARYDLLHVIQGHKSLEEVILPGPEGIAVLPAARGLQALSRLAPEQQEWLAECFGRLARPVDVVLVDARAGSALPLTLAAEEVVVVVSPAGPSITEAYALIKSMNQDFGKRHFRLLVNRARTEQDALAIFNNVARTASHYLAVSLDYMGFVPVDDQLRRSTQLCCPVVDAFPAAPSATSFRRMANSLASWPLQRESGGGLENFMHRLIRTCRTDQANISLQLAS